MRQPTGVVVIDGQPFFLAKDEQGRIQWEERWEQRLEGDPARPARVPSVTWHKGMGDERGARPGSTYSSANAYLGHEGAMLPGPAISTIATLLPSAPVALIDVGAGANRRLIAFAGRYAVEVNSAHAVTLTQDFGAGKNVTDAVEYKGTVAVAMGDGVRWWYRNTSGAYVENTFGATPPNEYRYADCFGVSDDGFLVRGRAQYWSKCVAEDYWTGTGQWGAENPIGSPNRKILDVFSHNRWDYVLKEDGLYAFDEALGDMVNDLPDMKLYPVTEASHFNWYNRLFLCLPSGLVRYVQLTSARTVGLEEIRLNTRQADSYPTAGIAYSGWAYVAYYRPATDTTDIIMLRNYEDGDTSSAPFTPVSVIDSFSGKCKAMVASDLTGEPRIYYGRGGDIGHFAISRNGLPNVYRTTGVTTVIWVPPDRAPHTPKLLSSIEVKSTATVSSPVTVAHSWDGATWTTDGTVTSSGVVELPVTTNQTGYDLWLRVTLTNASASNPVSVTSVIAGVNEMVNAQYVARAVLRLRDYDQEGGVQTRLTAEQQVQRLRALVGGGAVSVVTPYGEARTLLPVVAGAGNAVWPKYHEPQALFEITFREP